MDIKIISDEFEHQIKGGQVVAAVFTTFNFEPHFFETDVIPYLLDKNIPYSTSDDVKKYQVMEALRESPIDIEVFYDAPVFENSAGSPSMEYAFHGIYHGNAAFHAKNNYLLVNDGDDTYQKLRLVMSSGSNNITRTGWWDNIETQHWISIDQKGGDAALIDALLIDLTWLREKRSLSTSSLAIEKIEVFLEGCPRLDIESTLFYYGIHNRNFPDFLQSRLPRLAEDQHWQLEIISPFFVDDPTSDFHSRLFELQVNDMTLILPRDADGSALCERSYHETILNAEHIQWGEWTDQVGKVLAANQEGSPYRKLHAKLFHFYSDTESWLFSGSVNFTHKAFYDNVESGFLIRMERCMDPLLNASTFDDGLKFQDKIDLPELGHSNEIRKRYPIHLSYNWKEKYLSGRIDGGQVISIVIMDQEGRAVTEAWALNQEPKIYGMKLRQDVIEKSLTQTGFVTIKVIDAEYDGPTFKQMIPVLQTGWTHKPIELPDLTPQEILSIYAGLPEAQRRLLLLNARIKTLISQGKGGEVKSADEETGESDFFCEFAEIFYAFKQLRDRLMKYLEDEERYGNSIDYYLSGTGADSLPTLEAKASELVQDNSDAVTAYLILLSIREVYDLPRMKGRLNLKTLKSSLDKKLEKLEESNLITLDQGTDRKQFFTWFRDQFTFPYERMTRVDMQ